MTKETAIKLFNDRKIRTHWSDEHDKWYFSIVDVIEVLTDNSRPRKYWSDLKSKLKKEGSELSEKIGQLKLSADDGKMRLTDVADTEQLFRLIQSIPSPKAEPFKLWLAQVASERIDEIEDPEIGIDRLMETYLRKGYSTAWINQRLKSIEIRKELTDEWDNRGVKKGQEYAILTDEISKAWSGFTTKQYKVFKSLKKENLRDHMTNLELVLNMLAEATTTTTTTTTTTEIYKEKNPENFEDSRKIAKQGGTIAGNTRKEIESKTGKAIISKLNAKQLDDKQKGEIED
jgi:hypothetical protein